MWAGVLSHMRQERWVPAAYGAVAVKGTLHSIGPKPRAWSVGLGLHYTPNTQLTSSVVCCVGVLVRGARERLSCVLAQV